MKMGHFQVTCGAKLIRGISFAPDPLLFWLHASFEFSFLKLRKSLTI